MLTAMLTSMMSLDVGDQEHVTSTSERRKPTKKRVGEKETEKEREKGTKKLVFEIKEKKTISTWGNKRWKVGMARCLLAPLGEVQAAD
jgi:uncharacterized protein YifE (UPF0438 family)